MDGSPTEMNGATGVYRLPFAHGSLTFGLPPGIRAHVAALPVEGPAAALPDDDAAIAAALAQPLGAPPLRELARAGQRVCIVVTDATRACPDHRLAPAVIAELLSAGVAADAITILVGLGLHRPSTPEEKRAHLGEAVLRNYHVIDHDLSDVVALGESASGAPLWIAREVAAADLVIATGIVEPHPHAGFSGGAKTVAIGAGGEPTIAFTHSPAMLDRPGVSIGIVAGNPFQDTVREGGRRARLRFVVNTVLNAQKQMVAVAAGDPIAVHDHLWPLARRLSFVVVPQEYDAIIAGVGYPKDENLYQATRAAINIVLSPRPAVKQGGMIIVAAAAPEGAGVGLGEGRFRDLMRRADDPQAIIDELRRRPFQAGEQAAYMVAKTMLRAEIVIVGARQPTDVTELGLTAAATMAEATALLVERCGPAAEALVIPQGLLTVVEATA